jgi:DNA modification methylase
MSPVRIDAGQTGCKPKDLIGIPWMLAFALRVDGWYLRQDIIWHKPNPMPESVRDRCTKAHEYIFLLSKSERYFFDSEAIKEPCKQDWGTRDRKNGKYHNDGTGLQPHGGLEKSYTMANKRSVWTVATRPYKDAHFATFPPALIDPCILAGSRPGDIVLDPFMGSGTTAAVALQHGRQYLGCELNPEYGPLQDRRIAAATFQNSLF